MIQPVVNIIVPVHDAFESLRECLGSLSRTVPVNQSIEIIDDASTDARVWPLIEEFASTRSGVRTVRQPQNLGFVQTVNGAMRRSRFDVILLNSDTITTRGWLEAMQRCAASDPRIATVTPFSNNAEICSFPEFCVNNPVPRDPERVAATIRLAASRSYPDLPTAVGFCMLVRRRCLDQLGLFDAERYGAGYGEENDFCMRASHAGFRNVLCDDAYVVHLGGQSFLPKGLAPGGENMAKLLERYPEYQALVADFIRRDPIRQLRENILARQPCGEGQNPG